MKKKVEVAIVDYGLGNLFSVFHACTHAGMNAHITSAANNLLAADVVILPGVGAFGDAMNALKQLDLIAPLKEFASSGKVLAGICLGMQLLMNESNEFGTHEGLGIVPGVVRHLENPIIDVGYTPEQRKLKVPHVGWNRIWPPPQSSSTHSATSAWDRTPLRDIDEGEYMYFVHSYFVQPKDDGVVLSTSRYGQIEFCSSLQYNNVFACQFHPERSGEQGLKIYHNIATMANIKE